MNVKKTKSSKKIVLKTTMSMTIGPMPFQTPAVSVSALLERLRHSLLVDDQIGDHLLYAAHPLLEFLVLLGHSLPL